MTTQEVVDAMLLVAKPMMREHDYFLRDIGTTEEAVLARFERWPSPALYAVKVMLEELPNLTSEGLTLLVRERTERVLLCM